MKPYSALAALDNINLHSRHLFKFVLTHRLLSKDTSAFVTETTNSSFPLIERHAASFFLDAQKQ